MLFNKFLPFVLVYFFFNSLGLPFGLTYMTLLSPLFYAWITVARKKELLLPFLVALVPFVIAHFIIGVAAKEYLVSLGNYAAVYVFCQAFYTFLLRCDDKQRIFRQVLEINFIACLLSLLLFYTPYGNLVWMQDTLTDGVEKFRRLKLFTYEASYYAILFVPFFFFFLVQFILRQNKINSWLLLTMLLLPLVLSFSVGVIGSILLSVSLVLLLYFRSLIRKKRVISLLILFFVAVVVVSVTLWLAFPGNTLFLRLENILAGKDTSGNGRTFDAFVLARQMIHEKSAVWGIGAGQVKLLGADIVRSYYLYDLDYSTIAIPNAAAETLAIFGWLGFILRLLLELFLFLHTRVWKNYYRLLLFLFILIYQFTGSYITNMAEYVIWILAFTNAFPEFDVLSNRKQDFSKNRLS